MFDLLRKGMIEIKLTDLGRQQVQDRPARVPNDGETMSKDYDPNNDAPVRQLGTNYIGPMGEDPARDEEEPPAPWHDFHGRDQERRECYDGLVFEEKDGSTFQTLAGQSGRVLLIVFSDGARGLSSTDEIEGRLLAQEVTVKGRSEAQPNREEGK